MTSDGIESECTMCKNGQYLLDDVCVAACPTGYAIIGYGDFDLQCINIADQPICAARTLSSDGSTCKCDDDNCHQCNEYLGSSLSCLMCKNAHYLLEKSSCVETCPTGYAPRGGGSYTRECMKIETCAGRATLETGTACLCRHDCHKCEWAPKLNMIRGTCVMCKNGKYLDQSRGECVSLDQCPEGTIATGAGDFGNVCQPV